MFAEIEISFKTLLLVLSGIMSMTRGLHKGQLPLQVHIDSHHQDVEFVTFKPMPCLQNLLHKLGRHSNK